MVLAGLLIAGIAATSGAAPGFTLVIDGEDADAAANSLGGSALMGGGPDVDDAFAWMAERADGGDFVVLRASGGDAYNAYITQTGLDIGLPLDSVATIITRTRSASAHPEVLAQIAGAEAIFIAGGDQAAYLDLWLGTPLQDALQDRIDAGAVVGGTSAGLVVLSGHVYSAKRGTVTSREALRNPFNRRITLADPFLDVPYLENVLADTHFSERNREGRLVAFLSRLYTVGPVRGVGVDEATALLVDETGQAIVVGDGGVLLVDPTTPPERLRRKKPLSWSDVPATRADAGDTFDLATWTGTGLEDEVLTARRGRIHEDPAP